MANSVTGKIARKYMAHFLDSSFGGTTPAWYRIGEDLEEYNVELNPDTEVKKNILGNTTFNHNGYEPLRILIRSMPASVMRFSRSSRTSSTLRRRTTPARLPPWRSICGTAMLRTAMSPTSRIATSCLPATAVTRPAIRSRIPSTMLATR